MRKYSYPMVSPIAMIHESRNPGVGMGTVSLIITPNHPLGNYLLPVPEVLSSASLEVLGAQTSPSLFWVSGALDILSQHAKKGKTALGGMTDYQGETGLLLHNGEKEDYVCSAGDP